MHEIIDQKFYKIRNNFFVNDMNWRERAKQNFELAKEIRDILKQSYFEKSYSKEILQTLKSYNL